MPWDANHAHLRREMEFVRNLHLKLFRYCTGGDDDDDNDDALVAAGTGAAADATHAEWHYTFKIGNHINKICLY